MKRYLVNNHTAWWGGGQLPPRYHEAESWQAALDFAISIYGKVDISDQAIHRGGWPYWTLTQPKNGAVTITVTGMGPYDTTLARIYEIDVPEGKDARQVFDEWHDEQKRLEHLARQAEWAKAKNQLPFIYQGPLYVRQPEYTELMIDDTTTLQERVFVALFGGYPDLTWDEMIDLGQVRITIERVESDES